MKWSELSYQEVLEALLKAPIPISEWKGSDGDSAFIEPYWARYRAVWEQITVAAVFPSQISNEWVWQIELENPKCPVKAIGQAGTSAEARAYADGALSSFNVRFPD